MKELYERYPILKECDSDIESVVEMLCESYKSGGKLSDGFPAANKGVLDKEVNLFTKRQKIM